MIFELLFVLVTEVLWKIVRAILAFTGAVIAWLILAGSEPFEEIIQETYPIVIGICFYILTGFTIWYLNLPPV